MTYDPMTYDLRALTRAHHLEPPLRLEGGGGDWHLNRPALGISGREAGGERAALALGEGPYLLVLRNPQRYEQPAAAGATPAPLAHQQVADRHALCFPRAIQDHLYDRGVLQRNPSLELSPGEPNAICLLECAQVLRRNVDRGDAAHETSPRTSTIELPQPRRHGPDRVGPLKEARCVPLS